MKVNLQTDDGWELFEVDRNSKELKKRNISLGSGCSLGNKCSLGDGCGLGDGCRLGDECLLGSGCILGNECGLGDGCILGDGCVLGNGCRLSRSPLYIIGTRHLFCQYSQNEIKIGCCIQNIDKWLSNYKQIGEREGYNSTEIKEYGLYLKLAKKLMNTKATT